MTYESGERKGRWRKLVTEDMINYEAVQNKTKKMKVGNRRENE